MRVRTAAVLLGAAALVVGSCGRSPLPSAAGGSGTGPGPRPTTTDVASSSESSSSTGELLPECVETDVGNVLGSYEGTTVGEDDDFSQSCAGGGARDHVVRFVAPRTGVYRFSTQGSNYDSALSIHDQCGPGSELACDDDGLGNLNSLLILELFEEQQVLVAVSGCCGEQGSWRLSITEQ